MFLKVSKIRFGLADRTKDRVVLTDLILSSEDNELVNEVLEDISSHEEDYLDLTLEEESELINTVRGYLDRGSAHAL